MNFFQRQAKARQNTKLLIALFGAAVVTICFAIWYLVGLILYSSEVGSLAISPARLLEAMPGDFNFWVIAATLIAIAAGCLHKIYQLSKDASAVAQQLGGKLIVPATYDQHERRLLNIVEEMSIASSVPMPKVYILDDESINAFAAGTSYENAVIGVTHGAITLLNRAELQGVIAHEFSHIFNGDMRLNIKAIGVLNGILFISVIGRVFMRPSRRSNKKGGGYIVIIGVALWLVGSLGVFFGSAIKAAINRQREYLADASAVQFTREPQGLAGALKKIGGSSSILSASAAAEFSHLYFSSGIRGFLSFATHPPLEERIRAIEPSWDGKFITPEPSVVELGEAGAASAAGGRAIARAVTTAAVLGEIDSIGELNAEKLDRAHLAIGTIGELLRVSAADALGAQFVVFALLLDADIAVSIKQRACLRSAFTAAQMEQFERVAQEAALLDRANYLNLIYLAAPSLKLLSPAQYAAFRRVMNELIDADFRVTLFERNLKYLALYPLEIAHGDRKIASEIYGKLSDISGEAATVLSAIVYERFGGDEKGLEPFNAMIAKFGANLAYAPHATEDRLEAAYNALQRAKPELRQTIVEMALFCLKSDGIFDAEDTETIHAFCALMRLPILV
ncbi:Zn-dependent protease [Campylobacterota bacterium]|nr:Zn-dependent protease [Campylobacterota bacterium]